MTSKTKTKKNDVKALYQWVVNANAGDRLLFTAGLDRRKNLDILVKNLIDNNASLNLTSSYPSIKKVYTYTIKMISKPSLPVILPAVQENQEISTRNPIWRNTKAREELKLMLENDHDGRFHAMLAEEVQKL